MRSVVRVSVIGLAIHYGLDGLGSKPGGDEFCRTRPYQPWDPLILMYNWYLVPYPGVKRPGRDVDHPLHLVPTLKKEYRCTYTPPLGLYGLVEC
jgi:hypothetical protein